VIDLLFTNRPDLFSNVTQHPGLGNSDHDGVKFDMLTSYDYKTMDRSFYQYNKANIDTLGDTLRMVPWDTCFSSDNIDEIWGCFKDLLFAAVKDIVPIAKCKGRKKHPWISDDITVLSKTKNRAFKAAIRNKANHNLWAKYKKLRNEVKYRTRQSYCAFINDMATNCSNNPKQFWSFVSTQRRKSTITSFQTDNGVINDPVNIAQNFNLMFQSNFSCDSNNIIDISCDHVNSGFRLSELNMHKSCGPDDISPMLSNPACGSLAQPLAKLFNLSLATGVVLHEWKLANVVPLFKTAP
jgi:hypothetical protein